MAGIPYKKQFVKPDGRKLNRSGPRDMQARTAGTVQSPDVGLVELLTNQLTELKAEVMAMKSRNGDAAPVGFFSPEQVDAEIIKAVEAQLANVVKLKKQIAVLEQEVEGKEELINILKTRPVIIDGEIVTDPDRPQMEQAFVDPLEEDAGKGMKASIKIETVVKDEEVGAKVNKLKDLLGSKLPTK